MNNIILFWAFEGSYNENLFLYLIIQELSLILSKYSLSLRHWLMWLNRGIANILIPCLEHPGWKYYFILFYYHTKLFYQLYNVILQYFQHFNFYFTILYIKIIYLQNKIIYLYNKIIIFWREKGKMRHWRENTTHMRPCKSATVLLQTMQMRQWRE